MATTDLHYLTISDAARLLRGRKLSPVELAQAVLQRIRDTQPMTNAFVSVLGEDALAWAGAAEKAIMAGGYRGPLHGIPIAVKDIMDVAGVVTTCASAAMHDNLAKTDAAAVARLKAAGAIVIGKTNLTEFAERFASHRYGVVHNPWDLTRCAGLSSSGSGAAVASGACLAALGNDTGGSVRVPAAFCGVVGIKPTFGRVSRAGSFPPFSTMDCIGPLARTVRDAALVLQAIAGGDFADPTSSARRVPPYTRALPTTLNGVKVGIPKQYFFEGLEPEVDRLVRDAIQRLRELGGDLVEVSLPHVHLTGEAREPLQATEGAASHQELLRERGRLYGPELAERLRGGMETPALRYVEGLRLRSNIKRELEEAFTKVDVLAMPTKPNLPYTAGPGMPGHRHLAGTHAPAAPSQVAPFSLTGLPAVSVPCGFSAGGLPAALQIAGPEFGEAAIIRVAHAYERGTDWHTRRPADIARPRATRDRLWAGQAHPTRSPRWRFTPS